MRLQSINTDQRLYVMPCGKGYTCYGWGVLDRTARAVAAWARVIPPLADLGTPGHFEQCAQIMEFGAKYAQRTGTRCDAELVPALTGLEGRRVEVVDCHGERRRFQVGKSTGWMPCHLELHNRRASGGVGAMGTPYKSVAVIR